MNKKAFISPSSLTILAQTIGSTIWYLLVSILASIILFFKKSRKLIMVIMVFFLLAFILVTAYKVHNIKKVNSLVIDDIEDFYEWQDFMKELGYDVTAKDKSEGLNLVLKNTTEIYIPDFNKTIEYINLRQAIDNGSYRLFFIYPSYRVIGLDTQQTKLSLLLYRPHDKELFQNLTREYNINKQDNIVIYCETGYSSRTIAVIFAYNGYDVKYSSLKDIQGSNYLQANHESKVLVIPISNIKQDSILLAFNPDDEKFAEKNNINSIKIYNDKSIDLKDQNIICSDKINCFLTKHYLYYQKSNISEIYLLENE